MKKNSCSKNSGWAANRYAGTNKSSFKIMSTTKYWVAAISKEHAMKGTAGALYRFATANSHL